MKGLFILFIVLGHNTLLTQLFPPAFPFLYNFHVFAFFLLPFLFPSAPFTASFVRDRAVRYLVPYVVFYAAACVLFRAFEVGGEEPIQWVLLAVRGVLLGTAWPLKAGSGLQLYWFLPALLSLALLRSLHASLGRFGRGMLLTSCLGAHVSLGLMPVPWRPYLVQGTGIALFTLPLGLAARVLWERREIVGDRLFGLLSAISWVATSSLALWLGSQVNLGLMNVYGLHDPGLMVLHAILPIWPYLTALSISSLLARIPGLSALGRHSLVIYLGHSLIYQLFLRLSEHLAVSQTSTWGRGGLLIASLAFTVALSAGTSVVVSRNEVLRRLVVPRSFADWWLSGYLAHRD